jgi:hypothetical protein
MRTMSAEATYMTGFSNVDAPLVQTEIPLTSTMVRAIPVYHGPDKAYVRY